MLLNRLASLVRYAGMAVWSIVWISTALLLGTLTRDSSLPLRFARRFWAPGMLWFSGAELRITGLPESGWDRPAIYVMNHQSSLDIPAAFAILPVDLRFIAKHTLRKVPFLGWYMSWTGMVFVDRSNSTQAVGTLNAAADRVRGGISLLAYPEGTRSRDGTVLPFKKGPFVLALQAGVPIVPVAIQGSLEVMPSGLKPLRPGVVRVAVGAPLPTADLTTADRDELVRRTRDAVVTMHAALSSAASRPESTTPSAERPSG
ncbi:MAG TPA: lysophospholipid acyltransferase family protein [Myxococcaceae bacterium]|nr:lysophospholipid acyltransferase family protein [Myxococcaceae bacterium]